MNLMWYKGGKENYIFSVKSIADNRCYQFDRIVTRPDHSVARQTDQRYNLNTTVC